MEELLPLAAEKVPNAITRIGVQRLFGRFTYHLELPAAPTADLARLMILYGDNGSGKTTILRSLFHLISSSGSQGHRTYLASVPFQELLVSFSNGLQIAATRTEARKGDYRIELSLPGSHVFSTDVQVTAEGRVTPGDNPQLDELERLLSEAVPQDIYYVGDDRRLQSDSLTGRGPRPRHGRRIDTWRRARDILLEVEEDESPREADLQNTLERAIEWLRQQAIKAANLGSQSSNHIYADVLRRIATPSLLDDPSTPSLESARQRLEVLADRNREYTRFGLVPAFDSEVMLAASDQVPDDRRDAFVSVLVTFMDGLEARLDALASLFDAIDAYVDAINAFLVGKQLAVVLPRDIVVQTTEGEDLQPDWLSSGERQLLLLLTNTLFAHERPGIFIIDEPELSLNMKWQRKLVDALLSTTRGTETQFVLATHSFEVMTSARDRVLHLAPFHEPLPLRAGSGDGLGTGDDA